MLAFCVALCTLFSYFLSAAGSPLGIQPRDQSVNGMDTFNLKIWVQSTSHCYDITVMLSQIPVAVTLGLLTFLATLFWIRRSRSLRHASVPVTPTPVIVTASQLTGVAPSSSPRRPRRPRRTPSQISTKSLPEYMKEPGEQGILSFLFKRLHLSLA